MNSKSDPELIELPLELKEALTTEMLAGFSLYAGLEDNVSLMENYVDNGNGVLVREWSEVSRIPIIPEIPDCDFFMGK